MEHKFLVSFLVCSALCVGSGKKNLGNAIIRFINDSVILYFTGQNLRRFYIGTIKSVEARSGGLCGSDLKIQDTGSLQCVDIDNCEKPLLSLVTKAFLLDIQVMVDIEHIDGHHCAKLKKVILKK